MPEPLSRAPLFTPDAQWVIPPSMRSYPSVFEWWEHLREVDDAIHQLGFATAVVDEILYVVEQLRIELFEPGPSRGRTARVRRHVVVLVGRFGFTPEQVVAAIGIDEFVAATIVSMLAPAGRRVDDLAKVEAITLMRAGVPLAEVEAVTGLTANRQLPYLAGELGIEYRTAHRPPPSVRAQALLLLGEGLTAREVVEVFEAEGEHLGVEQVRKWRQRERARAVA
jgi:hypothetical protein